MAPGKKKASRQEARKATATNGAAAGDGATGGLSTAAKQAAELFKQFKMKQDAKLLYKLKEAVHAGPCAASHLLLAKALVLRAVEPVLTRGQPPPYGAEARVADVSRLERERAEDELEGEVVALLGEALQQAVLGVPIAAPNSDSVAPARKEKGFRCLMLAALLAGVLRGRGSNEAIAERQQWVERLRKFVAIAQKMEAAKGLPWLAGDDESPVSHRWPYEIRHGQPLEKQAGLRLQDVSELLRQAAMADDHALEARRTNGVLSPMLIGSLVGDHAEPERRVQERLSSWTMLPFEMRKLLADRYHNELRGSDTQLADGGGGGGGAIGAVAGNTAAERAGKITREEAAKRARLGERVMHLNKVSSKAEESRRRKEATEAAQRAAADAALAARLQERAGAAKEVLMAKLAAAGDSKEAQMQALLGNLRMSLADIKQGLQRAARDKERSEIECNLSRICLKRLPTDQRLLYHWTPEIATALASHKTGGRGTDTLQGSGPSLLLNTNLERCRKSVEEAVSCSSEDLFPLLSQQLDIMDPMKPLLQDVGTPKKVLDLGLTGALLAVYPEEPLELHLPQALLPEDVQLLSLACEGRHPTAAYKPISESYKQLPPGQYAAVGPQAGAPCTTPTGGAESPAAAEQGGQEREGPKEQKEQERRQPQEQQQPQPQQQQQEQHEGENDQGLTRFPLAEYMCQTWATHSGLAGTLVTWEAEAHSAGLPPGVEVYGQTYEFVQLAMFMVAGQQLLVLLEAAEKEERPEGWPWWLYSALSNMAPKAIGGEVLAALQPDRQKAVAAAAAVDAFTRWLIPAHMRLESWLTGPQPPQQQQQQQQADHQQAVSGSAAAPTTDSAVDEQSSAPAMSDGATGADPAAVAVVGGSSMPAECSSCESPATAAASSSMGEGKGEGEEDEVPQFTSTMVIVDVLGDYILRGLAAVSLATGPSVPTKVAEAAAAATKAGEAGSTEGDSAEAARPPAVVADWVARTKREIAARIDFALRKMRKEGAVTLPLMEAILGFIQLNLPPEGLQEVRAAAHAHKLAKQASAAAAESSKQGGALQRSGSKAAVQGQVGLQQHEQRQEEGQQGQEVQQVEDMHEQQQQDQQKDLLQLEPLPSQQIVLAHMAYMPLTSLHQLFAFVCLQLAFRSPGMSSLQELLQAGDDELMSACLQLLNNSQTGGSSGKSGGSGKQAEVAVAEEGLLWALLSLGSPPANLDGLQDEGVEVADIVDQLIAVSSARSSSDKGQASNSCSGAGSAAVKGRVSNSSDDNGIGGGGSVNGSEQVAEGQEAVKGEIAGSGHSVQAEAAGEAASTKSQLPAHLRLRAAAASWQPPATLAGQLRLLAYFSAEEPGVTAPGGSQGGEQATSSQLRLQVASKHAGQMRMAAFYMDLFHEVADRAQRLRDDLDVLQITRPLASLQRWVDKVSSSGLALPPPPRWKETVQGLLRVLVAAGTTQRHATLCVESAHYKSNADAAALHHAKLEAAKAELMAAESEGQRQRLQDQVDEAAEHLAQCQQQRAEHGRFLIETDHRIGETIRQMHTAAEGIIGSVSELDEARKPFKGSMAALKHNAEVVEARSNILINLDYLEEACRMLTVDLDDHVYALQHLCEQLYLRVYAGLGTILKDFCIVSVRQRLLCDLLQHLLPAAWQAELTGLQAAQEQSKLLLEEERERERQRQAEAKCLEAERKAKAKRAKKAGGGGGKAAGKAEWQEQLDEVADEVRDVEGSEEGEEAEQGAVVLSPEQQRNLEQLYAAVGEEGGDGDEEDWQQAGAPRQHTPPPPRRGGSGTSGRGSEQRGAPAVLHVVRPRSGAGDPPSAAAPRQALHKTPPSGNGWGLSAGDPSAQSTQDSWGFGDSWGQPPALAATAAAAGTAAGAGAAAVQQQASWAQRARVSGQAGDSGEVDSLMATMLGGSAEVAPEEEDADLAAAIAASLAHAQSSSSAGMAVSGPGCSSASYGDMPGLNGSTGAGLAVLQNDVGQYNCFLNVIVQCLWRCAEFRQQVAQWPSDFAAADPVLAALHSLFHTLQEQEEQEREHAAESIQQQQQKGVAGLLSPSRSGGVRTPSAPASPTPSSPSPAATPGGAAQQAQRGGAGSRERAPVDPGALRVALGNLEGHSFGLGEMHDPAEVLLCLYEKVMEVAADQGRPAGIDSTFGLKVQEEVACHACHKTTHQTSYTQYFHNTQATALQMQRLVLGPDVSMGSLLREVEAQHQKSCDEDLGGCGTPNPVNHFLEGSAPRVFTLQVAWESHTEAPDAIGARLEALDEEVDLGEVYQGADRGVHRYRLRSMVCYYGRHYQALVLVPEAGGWLMFDDTRVSRVGGWAEVRRKCEAGRIQPSVLFYEAIQG